MWSDTTFLHVPQIAKEALSAYYSLLEKLLHSEMQTSCDRCILFYCKNSLICVCFVHFYSGYDFSLIYIWEWIHLSVHSCCRILCPIQESLYLYFVFILAFMDFYSWASMFYGERWKSCIFGYNGIFLHT